MNKSLIILLSVLLTLAVGGFLLLRGGEKRYWVAEQRPGLQVLTHEEGFLIVADTAYAALLDGNRILAYSDRHAWQKDIALKPILDYYEDMLATALRLGKPYSTPTQVEVLPLLPTDWGQDAPYNEQCPVLKSQPTKAGCLPVAMAQLVAYHQPALRSDSVALIARMGKYLRARYAVDNTTAGTHRVKNTLQEKYGFAASCRLRKGLTNKQLLQLAERNLKAGNPLLLSNRVHAFLADGMKQDYLHLNLGIGGPCNGYYRILAATGDQWERTFATTIFTDIRLSGEPLTQQVQVQQPGTLAALLGEQALDITRLTVSGTLNGQDVALLRRMAGAVDSTTAAVGCLSHLDMRGARFVSGQVYHIEDAVQMKFIIRRNKETYDFAHLSAARWKSFCNKGYDRTPDYRVVQENGTYNIHFLLNERPNAIYLFMDCVNLISKEY